jgi:hypothetical protein
LRGKNTLIAVTPPVMPAMACTKLSSGVVKHHTLK